MNENKLQIAYSGVQGAFAYLAAGKIFPDGELRSYASFRQAYEAVETKECDYAVLPILRHWISAVNTSIITDLQRGWPPIPHRLQKRWHF